MNLARRYRMPVKAVALGALLVLAGILLHNPGPAEAGTNWTDCGDGWQCASIEVPLDYSQPNGATVEVKLSRLPAAGPGPKLGSLLFNFGGPGASTIDILPGIAELFAPELRQQFDFVAFDPRGVGHSSPISCNQNIAEFYGVDGSPDNEAEWTAIIAEAQVIATNCATNGPLLGQIGTMNVVRDMEQVRMALGEDTISYVGFSYGTTIGSLYADAYPNRVRAFVLDGAYNFWSGSGVDKLLRQSLAFEASLGAFLEDCRAHASCKLHSVGEPDDVLQQVLSKAEQAAIPAPRAARIGEITTGIAMALYDQGLWPDLEEALVEAVAGNATKFIELADFYLGRREDGSYPQDIVAYTAVECLDNSWPTLSGFRAAAAQAVQAAPHFGGDNLLKSALPCAVWPFKAQVLPAPTATGAAPILVIGTTGDPATPYEEGRELATRLESAHFFTHVGEGHTVYTAGNACIDDAVTKYLLSLAIVPDGSRCEPGSSTPSVPGVAAAPTAVPPTTTPPTATPTNLPAPASPAPLPPATGSGRADGVGERPWPVLAGLLGLGCSTALAAWWHRSRRAASQA